MSKIDHESRRLLALAAAGELPGYPESCADGSFCSPSLGDTALTPYFSGENDALETALKAQFAGDEKLCRCIPIILAAVEKSRSEAPHAVEQTALYNYTM